MSAHAAIKWGIVLGLLLVWEAVRQLDLVHAILLASPSEIVMAALSAGRPLLSAFQTTIGEIVVATLISWGLGVSAGIVFGMQKYLHSFFGPILSSAFAVPKIMFYPLLLVWLGIGPSSKIAFAVFISFFTIALTTMDAVRSMDGRYLPVARSFGASRLQLIMRVMIPLALPGIVSGLRIGTALAAIGVIVAEMLASFNGLGYWISTNRSMFDTPQVYLGMALALTCTIAINYILSKMEDHFGAWRAAERSRSQLGAKLGAGTL